MSQKRKRLPETTTGNEHHRHQPQEVPIISDRELTLFSCLEFAHTSEPEYVALESCSILNKESIATVIGNAKLVPLCLIAINYGQETENRRKLLYRDFMNEIKRLLENNLTVITYEDWSRCFNAIFTNILIGKLKQCSSYNIGTEIIVGFRSRHAYRKNDTLPLTNFYNATKKVATADVKDIMKMLHMVLQDSCCLKCDSPVNTPQLLVCREDYSSLYLQSSLEEHFHQFVTKNIPFNINNTGVATVVNESFHHLLASTATEAILLDTSHAQYKDAQVEVTHLILLRNARLF